MDRYLASGLRPLRLLSVCLALVALCGLADAQYTIAIGGGAGVEGTSATTSVLFDNAGDDLRGWSYGVCHDSADLALTAGATGSTTATINGGDEPDFESIDLFPAGLTHGVVICFTSCAVLGPGTGYELLTIDYGLLAAPGSYTVCFCGTLGSPPVPTLVVDTASAGITPTQVCGDIEIVEDVDPIVALDCTQSGDLCTCIFTFQWTNQGPYDSINVYEDGALIDTLAGTATMAQIEVPGVADYCFEPIRDGIAGAQTCCLADCAISDVFPDPVENLVCDEDETSCMVSLSWNNMSIYAFLTVTVDGVEVVTLPGDAQEAVIVLPGAGSFDVCISGETVCLEPVPATCCTAECLAPFSRGDSNGDGMVNIADPIASLELFIGVDNVVDCDDALDANDDGGVDVADPVYVLSYLFSGGSEPPAPFMICGFDSTDDAIRCDEFPLCP